MTIFGVIALVHSNLSLASFLRGHHRKSKWLKSQRISFQQPWQTVAFWTRYGVSNSLTGSVNPEIRITGTRQHHASQLNPLDSPMNISASLTRLILSCNGRSPVKFSAP